ncbi:hypothetical protein GGR55DRAFT_545820 [Xylaria sp. FL0064]|nr:hypothetical protein GGR55DRAFT_545820 [Xylaria sp. FL0064]
MSRKSQTTAHRVRVKSIQYETPTTLLAEETQRVKANSFYGIVDLIVTEDEEPPRQIVKNFNWRQRICNEVTKSRLFRVFFYLLSIHFSAWFMTMINSVIEGSICAMPSTPFCTIAVATPLLLSYHSPRFIICAELQLSSLMSIHTHHSESTMIN